MKLTANIVGATGLVGKQLVLHLLENTSFDEVKIFVRRELELSHPKLKSYIVNFNNPKTWSEHLNGDVLFSTLGTTLKQAGSKDKQYEVDFTFNLNLAKTAYKNGIKQYVLVSSIGANSESKLFYTRIKGELDDAVSKIGFTNLSILRPSSLTGDRGKKRIAEIVSIPILRFASKFILKNYRPISDQTVAKAMINAILKPNINKVIWEGMEVFSLSKEK